MSSVDLVPMSIKTEGSISRHIVGLHLWVTRSVNSGKFRSQIQDLFPNYSLKNTTATLLVYQMGDEWHASVSQT